MDNAHFTFDLVKKSRFNKNLQDYLIKVSSGFGKKKTLSNFVTH
jgi:hypothetical protein